MILKRLKRRKRGNTMLHTSIIKRTNTSPFSIKHVAIENTVKPAALSASIFRNDLHGLKDAMQATISTAVQQHAQQYFIKEAADSAKILASDDAMQDAMNSELVNVVDPFFVYRYEYRKQHYRLAKLHTTLDRDYSVAVQDLAKHVVKTALEQPCKAAKNADVDSAGGKVNMFTFKLLQQWDNDDNTDIQDLRSIATLTLLQTLDYTAALHAVQHEQYLLKSSQPGTKYARSTERLDDETMQAVEDTTDFFNQCTPDTTYTENSARTAEQRAATFIDAQRSSDIIKKLHLTEIQQRTVLTLAKYDGNVTKAAAALNRDRSSVRQNRDAALKKAIKAGIQYNRKCIPALVHGLQGDAITAPENSVQWMKQWNYTTPAYQTVQSDNAMPEKTYNSMQHAEQYFIKAAADSAQIFTASDATKNAATATVEKTPAPVYTVIAGKLMVQDKHFAHTFHPVTAL